MRLRSILLWSGVAALGATAFAILALARGETVSAAWVLVAAVCTGCIGYRFYSRIVSERIFALDDARQTPAVRLEDGKDFVPTQKWVVFGHHFAAIAGAGPLVGPILAAQFGFLPGTLWILIGVVLAGAVQDLVILCASLRRDGRSLGQMAHDEIGPVAGWVSLAAIVLILSLLIAVLALVVVNALAESPWGTVTVALTIPIALLMGLWMRVLRPGKVLEASAIGVILLAVALWVGRLVAAEPTLAHLFTFSRLQLAFGLIAYGFIAAVLPVWLLLAPRDYLSSFVKIGAIALLALGILVVLPDLRMPAIVSTLADGTDVAGGHGPVFAGSLFPFAFITIACGAISGFHSLVASGTTPKLVARERDCRAIAYGGMLMEGFVAIMALIAACALDPGVYFAMNSAQFAGKDPATVATAVTSWGFAISPDDLTRLASDIGENSVIARTGGAPTLAVGMAHIFAQATAFLGGPGFTAVWYHFAILFEALFILTTIDAGTRVGRFLVQNLAAGAWKPLGRLDWWPAAWGASALIVAGWGWFLYVGVTDPNGIRFIWPVFGIANQVLAAIALCVGTTVILRQGALRWCWVTLLPLAWLLVVTQVASWQRLFSADPQLGFLAQIDGIQGKLAAGALPAGAKTVADAERMIVNARIDAVLVAVFSAVVLVVLLDSLRSWWGILRRPPVAVTTPPMATPASPLPTLPRSALAYARAWAGEDAFERHSASCPHRHADPKSFWREWFARRASGGRCC
jgi:carbon starvation protein